MRFTLRWLLILVALSGFLAAVCFAFPVWLANLVMAPLPLILPGVFIVGLIYGPKSTRPFYIGALGPSLVIPNLFEVHSHAKLWVFNIMERLYSAMGRRRELLSEYSWDELLTDPIYLEALSGLLISVAAGFICLGVWAVFWKDRAEG
jgi:hypothetical protein